MNLKLSLYTKNLSTFWVICIEEPLELPDWNLLCLQRITADPLQKLFLFIFIGYQKFKSSLMIIFDSFIQFSAITGPRQTNARHAKP